MRWSVVLVGLCVACGGSDPSVGGADLDSSGTGAPGLTDPVTAKNRKEMTCEDARSWRSGKIELSAAPGVFNALQPLFTDRDDLLELRDKVSPGCDWSLEVVGSTAPVEQWVPMHHAGESFWSTNPQEDVSVDLIDSGRRLIHVELSHVSTRAEHGGDCGELQRVHIQAMLGEENDDKRVLSPDGQESRIGELIESEDDRRIELWFSAKPSE
ncbi:MAG: hypothetical protein H6718_21805 [Polyangiaceae bacterium]|nr:hypothetical protein [Myxococcales bacterium]MCB9588057.1 hypothetical protein [Polyangiaceae bacterium]